MVKYSVVLVASLMLFSGCGGGGSDTQTPPIGTTGTQKESSAIERQLRDDFGFAGASNVRTMDTNIVAFTYFKDGNKHFAIFDLAQKKKLSEKADFQGDVVTNSTKGSVTFANNTKVTVDTSDYTKQPIIASQPTYKEKKSAQEYIRDYYENDNSDWTIMQSFTYSSDNHSDAAVVVADIHGWSFYIYDIPSNGNPYIVHTINPPSANDEWRRIYNVRRIGGGKITFTGVSKGAGEKNYTYYYLDHYYANSSDNMGNNDNRSPEEIIRQKVEADQLHIVSLFTYTPQRHGAALVISTPGGRGIYFYDLDDPNYNTRYTIFSADDDWVVTDITMIGGALLTYTYYEKMDRNRERITVTYNFIDKYVVNDSSNNHQNNTGSEIGDVSAGENKTISLGSDIYLEATSISGLSAPLTYLWTDSNGNTLSRSSGFAYAGDREGTHTLYLTVTDRNGNYAKDYVHVTVTNNNSSYNGDGSLTQQFKNDIDNFEWSYISHAISPQGQGAVVLAQSDAGHSIIYLYGISGDGTVTREKILKDFYSTASNLRIYSGGQYSYTYNGETYYESYL